MSPRILLCFLLATISSSHADVVTGKSTSYQTDAEAEGANTGMSGTLPSLHRSHSDGAAAVGGATRASVFYDTAEAREAEEAAARASTFYLGSGAAPEQESQQQQQQEQQTVDARVERLLAAAHNLDDQQCGMPLKRFRKVSRTFILVKIAIGSQCSFWVGSN